MESQFDFVFLINGIIYLHYAERKDTVVKKVIFGCFLMLSGIIGGSAWLLAHSNLVERGAWSNVSNLFAFGRSDSHIIILFYALAIVGAVIAVMGLRKEK